MTAPQEHRERSVIGHRVDRIALGHDEHPAGTVNDAATGDGDVHDVDSRDQCTGCHRVVGQRAAGQRTDYRTRGIVLQISAAVQAATPLDMQIDV